MNDPQKKCAVLLASEDPTLVSMGLALAETLCTDPQTFTRWFGHPTTNVIGEVRWNHSSADWTSFPRAHDIVRRLLPSALQHGLLTDITALQLGFTAPDDPIWGLLGRITDLRRLDLRHCSLDALPQEVCSLQTLQVLILAKNRFAVLPPELGDLENLEVLLLTGNRLHALPAALGNLKKLRQLFLNQNNLQDLPERLSQLTQLQCCDLTGNRRLAPPSCLMGLPRLTELFVDDPLAATHARGEKHSLHFDFWDGPYTHQQALQRIQRRHARTGLHALSFAGGHYPRDAIPYNEARVRYPDVFVTMEWRREAYY